MLHSDKEIREVNTSNMLCTRVKKDSVVEISDGVEKKLNLSEQQQQQQEEKLQFKCPFEDPDNTDPFSSVEPCSFHKVVHVRTVPKNGGGSSYNKSMNSRAYLFSGRTSKLLQEIGGGDRMREMTTRFYAHCFRDHTLKKFMFESDGAAAHGQRLADWMVEQIGGEGTPWRDSGRAGNQRQISHSQAWHSERRSRKDRGKRFQLDDCRIWMRLMFLSGREVGLHQFDGFWSWYVSAIQDLIGIYEFTAPPYARESDEWAENRANYEKYKSGGFRMEGVIGVGRRG